MLNKAVNNINMTTAIIIVAVIIIPAVQEALML